MTEPTSGVKCDITDDGIATNCQFIYEKGSRRCNTEGCKKCDISTIWANNNAGVYPRNPQTVTSMTFVQQDMSNRSLDIIVTDPSNVQEIQSLKFAQPSSIFSTDFLYTMPKLTHLEIKCDSFESMYCDTSPIASLTKLTYLDLEGCYIGASTGFLGKLTSLKTLVLAGEKDWMDAWPVTDFYTLLNLTKLSSLDITDLHLPSFSSVDEEYLCPTLWEVKDTIKEMAAEMLVLNVM